MELEGLGDKDTELEGLPDKLALDEGETELEGL